MICGQQSHVSPAYTLPVVRTRETLPSAFKVDTNLPPSTFQTSSPSTLSLFLHPRPHWTPRSLDVPTQFLALHILFPFPALRSPRYPRCLCLGFLQVPTQMLVCQTGFLTPARSSGLALLYGVEHRALAPLALTLITWLGCVGQFPSPVMG